MSKKRGPWIADKIERRKVSQLIPYVRNARTHSPEQVKQIADSIERFGWTSPVLIAADGSVIAGHGRLLAAERLGFADVPVIVAPEHWTDAERRAYVLADNKIAANSGWDEELLRVELSFLQDSPLDIELSGFTQSEVTDLLNGWNPDVERAWHTKEDSDGLLKVIKVKCLQADTDAVLDALRAALVGFEGATVATA